MKSALLSLSETKDKKEKKGEGKCIFSRQGMHVASVLSIQMCWYLSPELF